MPVKQVKINEDSVMRSGKIIFLPKCKITKYKRIYKYLSYGSYVIYKKESHLNYYGPGVYKWFFYHKGEEYPIYVGSSKKDTLLRGISEAFRLSFSTNQDYTKLDTDYIIGTVIKILTFKYKKTCFWEHICDDPHKELELIKEYNKKEHKVLLQTKNSKIDEEWKFKDSKKYWKDRNKENLEKSEKKIVDYLEEVLKKILT